MLILDLAKKSAVKKWSSLQIRSKCGDEKFSETFDLGPIL
jgi:hypothetical protein